MISRTPYVSIWKELSAEKSMVFLAGPRQCGKTTLCKMLASDFSNQLYFNWDILTDKRELLRNPFFFQNIERKDESRPFVIFDEIHKYRDWKNYLKGVYDGFHSEYFFLVSGSGRLDVYQKGSDSLAGRYYAFHLWPFTLGELAGKDSSFEAFRNNPLQVLSEEVEEHQKTWERLGAFSGFPEPFTVAKPSSYRRWASTYHRQLIREDIRDLTDIRNIDEVEVLFSLLPGKVGSPLSIANLAGDLRVSYNTVKSWLSVFERFYLTFSISPWAGNIARAIHKERKTYLFDYAGIADPGAKFENMVALELFRAVSEWNDMGWGEFNLRYIRTKEGREVDFLIVSSQRPMLLVETKLTDIAPATNLIRFQKALNVPAIQLLNQGSGFRRQRHDSGEILIAPASWWLPNLP